ncbi:hypothetical protein LOTGIDRAFT_172940 [Lottia gigantea]|uniref:Uncharacterized protein n=1 Tax=Lottia gigantea TaxID=225164 RepID=V4B4P6_LOTGI|nr:hypothetical protein LOTGIDRAFT_172940 [Lottia gigantea]ESP00932.1 hypothetical protein LOTGIDRAFT_172940 [Lottia gigantea]
MARKHFSADEVLAQIVDSDNESIGAVNYGNESEYDSSDLNSDGNNNDAIDNNDDIAEPTLPRYSRCKTGVSMDPINPINLKDGLPLAMDTLRPDYNSDDSRRPSCDESNRSSLSSSRRPSQYEEGEHLNADFGSVSCYQFGYCNRKASPSEKITYS